MVNESTKKGQFVELDFTARIKQTNALFDTSIKEEAKKANMPLDKVKPLIFCIGEGMVLKGLDKALEEKELGKDYSIELGPKEAFGNRDAKLIKILPIQVFTSKGINPYPGLILNMDDMLARISAVSGGRVITDFNNPLAGKDILYNFKVKRILNDNKEKLECLVSYFLKEDPKKAIKSVEGNKALIETRIKWPDKFLKEITERIEKLTTLKIDVKSV
ncbi:peptidylprolyl isomerase [Nanoarchaeota archaeon]